MIVLGANDVVNPDAKAVLNGMLYELRSLGVGKVKVAT